MIRTLLVANRGEIARRVIRTARAMDIRTVAVFSDADAGAPHVREADRAVRLPGTSPADTYLRADLLVAAARRTGADAVHPGYGFLSENAAFATACAEAGLVFVGPTAEVIESMGSKITAKELMAAAGVPVLPGITVADPDQLPHDRAEYLPGDLAARAEAEVGFPVLVKAAYGGGGRGMRVVREPGDLVDAVASAGREAASAFGNGTVFLEHYVDTPRHIEVQVMGDAHGTVVHLFERECSIQRRYQKIVEESPSPAVDEETRAELGRAAVAAAQAVGYVGAGTVEFVMDRSGRFFFLEMNTRLQVEHPVTELVTGLDLVRLQLLVAEGHPLPREALEATITGHAVEVRLYAEDAAADFRPSTGPLHLFAVPDLPGVRVDAGFETGGEVSHHYDSMLAKVIAHGPTRDDARRTLARALAETRVHGPVTNRELLVGVLREDEFAAGTIDTGYLDRHPPAELVASAREGDPALAALAAALAGQAGRRASAPVLADLPSGWRNVPGARQRTTYETDAAVDDGTDEQGLHVDYRITGSRVSAAVGGTELADVVAHRLTPERVELEVGGVLLAWDVQQVGDTAYVDGPGGSATLRERPRFPDPSAAVASGSLLAPMPGTVVRVAVEVGDRVVAGTTVVVLEAMKMEHTVAAPHDGTVTEVGAVAGGSVETGAVLVVVEREGEARD